MALAAAFQARSASAQTPAAQASQTAAGGGLPLEQYQPKSMLHVPETKVARAKFPVIDFHTHITGSRNGGGIRFSMEPANCLAVMDRKNLRTMVSLTGSYGDGLREAIEKLQVAHPGRFVVFTEPAWTQA